MGNNVDDEVLGSLLQPSLMDLQVARGDSLKLITARGTEDGLTLRIDGRADWSEVLRELEIFLGERKRFLGGCEVSIEWLDRLPTREQSEELERALREDYGISIVSRRRRGGVIPPAASGERMEKRDARGITIPLFELQDVLEPGVPPEPKKSQAADAPQPTGDDFDFPHSASRVTVHKTTSEDLAELTRGFGKVSQVLGEELFFEDANAKVMFGTLRSGQRVETPFSLIIIGDVNPGADLVAGGDIVVIGSLRGTAHASAYDDECGDRVIIALQMQPMQLRLGSVISRGSDEVVRGAEIARIEDRRIVVERFNPRFFDTRRKRELP